MNNLGTPVYTARNGQLKFGLIKEEHLHEDGWMYYKVDWVDYDYLDNSLVRRDQVNIFNPMRTAEYLNALIRKRELDGYL